MVESTMVDSGTVGYKHPPPVPLSPQWLAPKYGDSKVVGDLPSTPKSTDLDVLNKRGDGTRDLDRKKDWWRTLSPGTGIPADRDRWREDERENISVGRRDGWADPATRDTYDARRDSKWSNRWGPEDKDKDFRREKWLDSEKIADGYRDKYVPSIRRDGEERTDSSRSWHSQSAANRGASALPKSAPGFGAGRGRGVGSVGFSIGRGKASFPPGSERAGSSVQPIGAPYKPDGLIHTSMFRYPRAKLLDIYRKCGGTAALTDQPESFLNALEVSQSTSVDPLAFITPNEDEKVVLEGIWQGEIVSSSTLNGMNKANRRWDGESEKIADDRVDPRNFIDVTDTGSTSEKPNEKNSVDVDPFSTHADQTDAACEKEMKKAGDQSVSTGSSVGFLDAVLSKKEIVEQRELTSVLNSQMEVAEKSPEQLSLLYIDPQGEVQGPFSGTDIIQWYEAGYFGNDLLVRVADAPDSRPFTPLGNVMPKLMQGSTSDQNTSKFLGAVESTNLHAGSDRPTTHKAPEDEPYGLGDGYLGEQRKTSATQSEAPGTLQGFSSFLHGGGSDSGFPDNIVAGVAQVPLEVSDQLFRPKDEHLAQSLMQHSNGHRNVHSRPSLVHQLEELELKQLHQLGLGGQQSEARQQRQSSLSQLPFHMQSVAALDNNFRPPIHSREGLQRALTANPTLDQILRREQLSHQALMGQQPYQHDYQHMHAPGLSGFEKHMLQQQEDRLIRSLSDQYLVAEKLMQSRQQQDVLMQFLQQKQHERELSRLLSMPAPQTNHERRISGVWEVDEFGRFSRAPVTSPLQAMERQSRLQHQSSLPTLHNQHERVGYGKSWQAFDDHDPRILQQNLQSFAEMQRLSTETYLQQPRNGFDQGGLSKESLQALMSGTGNPAHSVRLASWHEQLAQDQHMKDGRNVDLHLNQMEMALRNKASREMELANHQALHNQKLVDHQVLSSQDYMLHQLARNQQLNERKFAIDQQMREVQPSYGNLWGATGESVEGYKWRGLQQSGAFSNPGFPGVIGSEGSEALNVPLSHFKAGVNPSLQPQLFGNEVTFPSGTASYKDLASDEVHASVNAVEFREPRKLKGVDMDVANMEGQVRSARTVQSDGSQDSSKTLPEIQASDKEKTSVVTASFYTKPKSTTENPSKSSTGEAPMSRFQQAASRDISSQTSSNSPFLSASVKTRPSEGPLMPLAPQTLLTAADVKAFRQWCEMQMKELAGINDLSQLEYCISLPSALEAENYLSRCLGNDSNVQAFKGEFLRCRELMTPQMLQVFNCSDDVPVVSGLKNMNLDTNIDAVNQTVEARGGKKKTKKGKKIMDPSLLGFNVASNRMLMGEIQRADDI